MPVSPTRSRVYRRSSIDPGWKAAFLQARPPETNRVGVMFAIEGDRWMVTLQGSGGDHPPTDDEGFLAFARSLRSPLIHDVLRDAEPLGPVVAFANTANRRRHYERMARWPERLVVVGDSACAFNPTYGQGMAVGAQTAVVLGDRLAQHGLGHRTLDGFARPDAARRRPLRHARLDDRHRRGPPPADDDGRPAPTPSCAGSTATSTG